MEPVRELSRPEDILQKQVVEYLELIERMEPGFWFCAIPNAAKRSPKTAAYLKSLGLKSGAPDLTMVWHGRAHFIELKAPGTVQGKRKVKDPRADSQKAVHTQITLAGGVVVTLDNFDAVAAFLAGLGLPRIAQRVAA